MEVAMSSFGSRLKALRLSKGLTGLELGEILNVSNKTISTWENNTREPNQEMTSAIAKFFNVSTDYLINGTTSTAFKPTLSDRDEKDIQKRLELLMNDLDSETGLAFYNGDGEMDDETRELLRASLESALRITKLKAKEKFTPNKYRK